MAKNKNKNPITSREQGILIFLKKLSKLDSASNDFQAIAQEKSQLPLTDLVHWMLKNASYLLDKFIIASLAVTNAPKVFDSLMTLLRTGKAIVDSKGYWEYAQ